MERVKSRVLALVGVVLLGAAFSGGSTPSAASSISGSVIFVPESIERQLIDVRDVPLSLRHVDSEVLVRLARSDEHGRYAFAQVPPGKYRICWDAGGWRHGCSPDVALVSNQHTYASDVVLVPAGGTANAVWGVVRLPDGSVPGIRSAFFGGTSDVEVDVVDAAGAHLASVRANATGEFVVPAAKGAARLRVRCEGARVEWDVPGHGATAAADAERRLVGVSVELPDNRPRITGFSVSTDGGGLPGTLRGGETLHLRALIQAPHPDGLQWNWKAPEPGTRLTLEKDGAQVTWRVPTTRGIHRVYALVGNRRGGSDERVFSISVAGSPSNNDSVPMAKIASTKTACGSPNASPTPMPFPSAAPPAGPFLKFFKSRLGPEAYYAQVDPDNKRATLGDFWQAAGVGENGGAGLRLAYMNYNDLGLGRDMRFHERQDGSVFAWVTNYGEPNQNPGNADCAQEAQPEHAGLTVAMEYAPIGAGDPSKIVKFFVYQGAEAKSPRVGTANLDGYGEKAVPGLCQNCHGGPLRYENNADLKANFIPFDLAALRFPGGRSAPSESEQAIALQMNMMVARTGPTAAITALIRGWYGLTDIPQPGSPPPAPAPIQKANYVPAGWKGDVKRETLYRSVVAASCRTCHASFTTLSWDSYDEFNRYRDHIQSRVCGAKLSMPHAAITYINFWDNRLGLPASGPEVLRAYQDTSGWDAFEVCTGS